MKLRERLKQLNFKKKKKKNKPSFWANNYIQVATSYLPQIQKYKLYYVQKKEDILTFYCTNAVLKKIDQLQIPYQKENRIKKTIERKSMFKKLSILGIILLIALFFLNQLFLREITFDDASIYDADIYQTVEGYTKKIGPYLYLKSSVNQISSYLRTKFYYYGYVGIYKKGSKLVIVVKHQDVNENKNENPTLYGELIAKYNCRIDYVAIHSGIVLMFSGDTVKKGDVIVTSNMQYMENLYNKDYLVPIEGIVLGNTYRYQEIHILKKEKVKLYTGETLKSYQLIVGDKEMGKIKHNFEDYAIIRNDCLTMFHKLRLVETIVYEKKSQELIRFVDEARKISLIQLHQEFEKNRIDAKEKIVSIKELEYTENDTEFIFYYLVNYYENIVEYRPF